MQTATSNKKTLFVKKGQTRGPLLENILADVARHYKTSSSILKEKDTHADIVVCRRLYCYIAWKITNATLVEIGNQCR
jgi:chromosomal replication initiation ATPase DnaA